MASFIEKERGNFFALNKLAPFMDGHKGFICGGCFKNLFNGEKIKDIDIFFGSADEWFGAVRHFDEECGDPTRCDGSVFYLYSPPSLKSQ